ncbi:PIN domain-containing protein [Gluconacetobacter diazotrophicus]|uniref:PIN domain-containing protein n=1 Tax=Gluconacetobacter diazotrophicus TaxID=33996 RepID=UPI0012FF2D81|nr:PIN domain-containing protein [Gluconacetobacter diazotrophicus]
MATVDYNHVVVIDSQVVLEAKPLDQLPWGDLFSGAVLLLITRQVQTEIDRKKSDGRLGKRARAFNKLVDNFIETRIPAQVLTTPRVDVATVANRRIDWDALSDLDHEDGDDRIVAQALSALVDDPSKLVLLSHDMRPRDAAHTHGLRAKKLPEAWLREPEPSPDQRRINELEGKIRLLSISQPQLLVRLEVATPEPWQYREVAEARYEQIHTVLERKLAGTPQQRRGGRFDVGIGAFIFPYDREMEAWEAAMHEDIPLMHTGLTKLFAQHRVLVTVENEGTVSAENLSLEIRSGNTVLHSRPYSVLVAGPRAPHTSILHDGHLAVIPHSLVPRPRKPFRFYWDERGPGNHLILSCASFRQEKKHSVEVSVELLAGSVPKAQIEAIVTASNMKGDARGQLLIDVRHVAVPFGDAYDVDRATLKMLPPFVLPDQHEADDCTWFRNGGSEHKRI